MTMGDRVDGHQLGDGWMNRWMEVSKQASILRQERRETTMANTHGIEQQMQSASRKEGSKESEKEAKPLHYMHHRGGGVCGAQWAAEYIDITQHHLLTVPNSLLIKPKMMLL